MRDADHGQRVGGDGVALQREHDHDGEQQAVERERADAGRKLRSYQSRPLARSPIRRVR